ncbi:MAG: hypothetical protein COB33_001735 [Thiotrichaceae bacterium]|nr:hypothetical protein [Thiotrichaceae bacterium]
MRDAEVAKLIASQGSHIIIDLNGHTHGSRPAVLATRPVPIQINDLGYIGTMGAKFIDYILVDDLSVPKEQQPFFDEQLVHLRMIKSAPHTACSRPARCCSIQHQLFNQSPCIFPVLSGSSRI